MNRNHYMAIGVILLLLGLVILKIDVVTLNDTSTKFLAQQLGTEMQAGIVEAAPVKKTITIPPWTRFLCISVGAILMLHAMAMPKPK